MPPTPLPPPFCECMSFKAALPFIVAYVLGVLQGAGVFWFIAWLQLRKVKRDDTGF